MSKAVLISIRPKWCELIASGQKTVEVRKTKPSAILPLKCYIYCTKALNPVLVALQNLEDSPYVMTCGTGTRRYPVEDVSWARLLNGMVCGEFVCHNIFPLSFYASEASFFDTEPPMDVPGTCLTDKEIAEYLGNGKTGYGWLISELVIYDKPKELYEFRKLPCERVSDCGTCKMFDRTNFVCMRPSLLTRPPQSWCYVEEET